MAEASRIPRAQPVVLILDYQWAPVWKYALEAPPPPMPPGLVTGSDKQVMLCPNSFV